MDSYQDSAMVGEDLVCDTPLMQVLVDKSRS